MESEESNPLSILWISTDSVLSSTNDVDESWCLIESQDWVGSDVVRPDCSANPSDPSCSDPTNVSPANERIANLYGDDVVSHPFSPRLTP